MIKELNIQFNNGNYVCDEEITLEMWRDILSDQELMTSERKDMLVNLYYKFKYQSASNTRTTHQKYRILNDWGKAICQKYDWTVPRIDDEREGYYLISVIGKCTGNESFEWELRPELLEAIENMKVPCTDLNSLVNITNKSLGKFTDEFRYKRKELTKSGRASRSNILFKYEDDTRDWAINEGGGTEVQYHISLRNDTISYGLGFNTQYVPFANENTPVGYMQPYANAYLKIKDIFPATLLKEHGFSWIIGKEQDLYQLEHNEYLLYGKTIDVTNNEIRWIDFEAMLSDIKGDLYLLYQAIFKHKLEAERITNEAMNKIENLYQLALHKKNIILQGAPGTGKTYTTASLAVRLCNGSFKEYSDHKKVMQEYERLKRDGQIAFCTFHQSMDYEDFVEGLKPEVKGNHIEYSIESGIFKSICERAQTEETNDIITYIDQYLELIKGYPNKKLIPTISGKSNIWVWWNENNTTISTRSEISQSTRDEQQSPSPLNIEKVKLQALGEGIENNWPAYTRAFIKAVKREYQLDQRVSNRPHVLIIDEINRGNISKIFGELITLLEADKRNGEEHGISSKLPYSKEDFSIPGNLYIIGTMNTTDRTTGSIDYAVRRRFAFVTLEANREVIEEYANKHSIPSDVRDAALALFSEINGQGPNDSQSFIVTHQAADFELEDLKVGHSYFLAPDMETLRMKMRYEVIPLIKEYIKDGILKDMKGDQNYFEQWSKAQCLHNHTTE